MKFTRCLYLLQFQLYTIVYFSSVASATSSKIGFIIGVLFLGAALLVSLVVAVIFKRFTRSKASFFKTALLVYGSSEGGCLQYDLFQSADAPQIFYF